MLQVFLGALFRHVLFKGKRKEVLEFELIEKIHSGRLNLITFLIAWLGH